MRAIYASMDAFAAVRDDGSLGRHYLMITLFVSTKRNHNHNDTDNSNNTTITIRT